LGPIINGSEAIELKLLHHMVLPKYHFPIFAKVLEEFWFCNECQCEPKNGWSRLLESTQLCVSIIGSLWYTNRIVDYTMRIVNWESQASLSFCFCYHL
jgi:hypothetical protein